MIISGMVGIAVVLVLAMNAEKENPGTLFHVTLADPDQYSSGLFHDTFFASNGTYSFRFVPNGDSPENLEISLEGQDFRFSDNFVLVGTLHQTGISEYYTWDYNGQKNFTVSESQEVSITINPNGDTLGPVSVSIREN